MSQFQDDMNQAALAEAREFGHFTPLYSRLLEYAKSEKPPQPAIPLTPIQLMATQIICAAIAAGGTGAFAWNSPSSLAQNGVETAKEILKREAQV